MKDYYKILGLPYNASAKDIREAYRRAAKKYHPDVAETGSHDRFLEIREAYEVLSDPDRRKQYDRKRLRETEISIHQSGRKRSRIFKGYSNRVVQAELILSRAEAYYGGLFTINVPFNILCTTCNGMRWRSLYCRQCYGDGVISVLMPITVKVPPRTIPGTVIIRECTDPWGRDVQIEFFCRIESLF